MLLALVTLSDAEAFNEFVIKKYNDLTHQQIAAAPEPIPVGTFTAEGKTWTVSCNGSGTTFRCNAFAKGVAKVGLNVVGAAVPGGNVLATMAAMNMQFHLLLPPAIVPDAAAIQAPE